MQVTKSKSSAKEFKVRGSKAYFFFKRVFDIFLSIFALVILSPVFLIVSLVILCTSEGPIIYSSERVSMDGKVFKFYKFRSMYKDADKRLADLLPQNEVAGGITFKMRNDPRITPVGKFLRKTSLDELPQLVNILKGEMSFVGPRPCTLREYKLYSSHHKKRLKVPQGLTGEWQVNGRSTTTFAEMIEMDLSYISEKRGFWYDIFLIIKTFAVVLSHKSGAE